MNAANERPLCFTTHSETSAVDTQHTKQGPYTGHMTDRMITAEQLRGKVRENNLSPQQDGLYNVLNINI